MAAILIAEVVRGTRDFTDPTPRTHRQERIPAPSAGSAMEVVREPTRPEDSPALAASTAAEAASMVGAAEVSTAVGAAMAAEATDSSHEVIKT